MGARVWILLVFGRYKVAVCLWQTPHSVPTIHQYSSALGSHKAFSELSVKAGAGRGVPYTSDLVHPSSESLVMHSSSL